MQVPDELQELTALARQVGNDVALVQGGGGNCSLKEGDYLYVKASGVCFKDMSEDAYAVVDLPAFRKDFLDEIARQKTRPQHEEAMNEMLKRHVRSSVRPSMEAAMHCFLSRLVLHTHAVPSNILLCMKDGERILQELFSDLHTVVVPYVSPGYALGEAIARQGPADVLFLQNHGVIVCGETVARLNELLRNVVTRCIEYIRTIIPEFVPFTEALVSGAHASMTGDKGFLFPDAVVYADKRQTLAARETLSAQRYIEETIAKLGGVSHYLPDEEVVYLQQMEAEKYRQQIVVNQVN